MATLEPHENTPATLQQPGSLPATALDDITGILRADGEAPWGLYLQQEAFTSWARQRGAVFERKQITGVRYRGGVEHEVVDDCERQRVIKITHPGHYGNIGSTRWGKLELVQAKPLEYLTRLVQVNQLFEDQTRVLGVILHSSGPRIVTTQPVLRGEQAQQEAIIAWMRSLGFAAVGKKTYWNAALGLALFDAHPGNVLVIPDCRLRPIDVVPCIADAQMTAFLNQRVKTWAAKH